MSQQSWWLEYVFPNITKEGTERLPIDFLCTIWIAGALIFLRILYERLTLPAFKSMFMAARPGLDPKTLNKDAFTVMDNVWIATFCGVLVAFAWFIVLKHNAGCTPWSTGPCLELWPNHDISLYQRWYMLFMFAYYLFELFGTLLGIGTRLKPDMVAHHGVTMCLITIAYFVNLVRFCCMWSALFDVSNPLLHMAKCLNKINAKRLETLKWLMFLSFALLFFVARVAMAPYAVLLPAFTTGIEVLPGAYSIPCCILMTFIYLLQLVWFYKIVQIATAGSVKDD